MMRAPDEAQLREGRAREGTGTPPTVDLMGLPVERITEAEAIDYIVKRCAAGSGGWVVTPNVDILRRIASDESLRRLVAAATLRLADGAPLIWTSRIQGTPLPERIPGASFIWSLSRAAAAAGLPIFLLGGAPGVATRASMVLDDAIPGLLVAGQHCPPLGYERSPDATAAIFAAVAAVRPKIVFCGLGCPKQERLMAQLTQAFPDTWFLGSGGSFDFIAGNTTRAPAWMQRSGLEWLHRLAHEPRRLFTRYVIHDIPFALRLLTRSMVLRAADRGRRKLLQT